MKMRQTRTGKAPVTDEVRVWVLNCLRKLSVSQREAAKESDVNKSWLSQVLSGRRRQAVDPALMYKLHDGLQRILQRSKIAESQQMITELRVHFAPFMDEAKSFDALAADSMLIAARLIDELYKSAPSNRQRLQVIRFVQAIVEKEPQ